MAAESAVHGDPHASDAGAREPSSGAVSPLQAPPSGSEVTRRVRSASEQKLIARGRYLLYSYQQKKREKRGSFDGVLYSTIREQLTTEGASNGFAKNQKLHRANNGHAAAAAASVDSEVNWLAKSVITDDANAHPRTAEVEPQDRTRAQLLDALEKRLEELCDALQHDSAHEDVIEPLRDTLSTLIQGKRKIDGTIVTTNQTATQSADVKREEVKKESNEKHKRNKSELEDELQEAKMLISELNEKVNVYRAQLLVSGSNPDKFAQSPVVDEVAKLQNRVQEKDELLVSLRSSLENVVQEHARLSEELTISRATIERLEGEMEQMQKAASDKRTLLRRAYLVKAKQLDQLCKDVDLPPFWERVTDENGIIYYRQNDRACAPELEDPRVPLVLEKLPISPSGSSSPRSAGGRMEKSAHAARSADRKYSSSSFDSTVSCEDIAIPPEDGLKHEVDDFETPLPEGWEMRVTTAGSVFFVNRNTNVTTWKDPRRMKRGGSTLTKRASAPHGLVQGSNVGTKAPERRASLGDLTHFTTASTIVSESESGVQTFDVVFEEKGPIGIHFQANVPDSGAVVRRLLPRMAASRAQVIEPFDRLVAVNKNPVDSAPFRYVMLLLQGGLRPLTLTFERDPRRRPQQLMASVQAAVHLDEEVVVDEIEQDGRGRRVGSTSDAVEDSFLQRPQRSASSSFSSASGMGSSGEMREDEYSVADKIITNLFSLFWTLPEQPRSQVETV